MFLTVARLKSKADEFSRALPLTIHQPPLSSVTSTIETILGETGKPISTLFESKEIHFDTFKKNLFCSDGVLAELESISNYAVL
jgi:hypothetical protein